MPRWLAEPFLREFVPTPTETLLINEAGNVCGMMPHPERASEASLGSRDGRLIFESLIK